MSASAEAASLDYYEPYPIDTDWRFAEIPESRRLVLAVPEQAGDELVRRRAAHFIGSVLTDKVVEESPQFERPIESLFDALQEAADGDREARQLVETCVATDIIERTYKTGHVSAKIPLFKTEEGKIFQYRQSMDSIQANSLRLAADDPVMLERTAAETRNSMRTEHLEREGWFDNGYSLLVISPAEDRPGTFFTETMSLSLQLTAKTEGQMSIEPAFVAGRAEDGEDRHDFDTIAKVGDELRVDLRNKTPAEIIDTPILIHNSLIPNGVVDVVRLYDDAAGGLFFGERKPQQNYTEYLESCRAREANFKPRVEALADQLIAEAPQISSKIEAIQRLDKLSGHQVVEQAMIDTSIDARIFGAQAASDIEAARWHQEQGEYEAARQFVQSAKQNQTSFSCPSAATRNVSKIESQNDDPNVSTDKVEDCDFVSKKCPVCGEKNAKTRVRNGVYYHVGKSCKG